MWLGIRERTISGENITYIRSLTLDQNKSLRFEKLSLQFDEGRNLDQIERKGSPDRIIIQLSAGTLKQITGMELVTFTPKYYIHRLHPSSQNVITINLPILKLFNKRYMFCIQCNFKFELTYKNRETIETYMIRV